MGVNKSKPSHQREQEAGLEIIKWVVDKGIQAI
jgi:hypothetical protein